MGAHTKVTTPVRAEQETCTVTHIVLQWGPKKEKKKLTGHFN
jgi:hypothetical protein